MSPAPTTYDLVQDAKRRRRFSVALGSISVIAAVSLYLGVVNWFDNDASQKRIGSLEHPTDQQRKKDFKHDATVCVRDSNCKALIRALYRQKQERQRAAKKPRAHSHAEPHAPAREPGRSPSGGRPPSGSQPTPAPAQPQPPPTPAPPSRPTPPALPHLPAPQLPALPPPLPRVPTVCVPAPVHICVP
jgi:hypothetical protein